MEVTLVLVFVVMNAIGMSVLFYGQRKYYREHPNQLRHRKKRKKEAEER